MLLIVLLQSYLLMAAEQKEFPYPGSYMGDINPNHSPSFHEKNGSCDKNSNIAVFVPDKKSKNKVVLCVNHPDVSESSLGEFKGVQNSAIYLWESGKKPKLAFWHDEAAIDTEIKVSNGKIFVKKTIQDKPLLFTYHCSSQKCFAQKNDN